MAKNWIKKAVKHPGRLTRAAEQSGVSKREKAEQWSHSSDPSKRAAGNLGKRFMKGGDLHGGSTVISRGSMKGKALTEGPANNKSLKNAFTNGSQRRDNLSLKDNPGKPPLFVPGRESAGQMGSSSAVSSNVGLNP